jgi:glycosyltransferase involved in cell wall biosynthesis
MRILVVHNHYQDPGGEDMVFHQEVTYLKQMHEVETLTFQNKKGWRGLFQYLSYPFNLWAGQKLRSRIKSFAPDVIHVHNIHYASGPILFRVAQQENIPVAFTLHNYRLVCPSALLFFEGKRFMDSIGKRFPWKAVQLGVLDHSIPKTFLTAFTYRLHAWLGTWSKVDAFLPLTSWAGKILLDGKLGINQEQIFTKPNFISPLPFSHEETEDYYIYIGRLSVEKGVKQLFANFDNDTAPHLKVIGEGPLRAIAPNRKNVELLGYLDRERMTQYILKAKAVIIPSICLEGFPLALLEGMSLRKLVIISQEIAASEIIADGVNGFKINPEDFLTKIKEIDQRKDLSAIAERGHQVFLQNFTPEKVMNQLNDIYRVIMDRKVGRG